MNYCNKCQSNYTVPGTCNCFAPVKIWTTAGSANICMGCGRYPCAGTNTGCPLPPYHRPECPAASMSVEAQCECEYGDRLTRGTPIERLDPWAQRPLAPSEEATIDKLNEIIDRINQMNEITP